VCKLKYKQDKYNTNTIQIQKRVEPNCEFSKCKYNMN
jgi:hypothetical protein